jgi:hypothetical protein
MSELDFGGTPSDAPTPLPAGAHRLLNNRHSSADQTQLLRALSDDRAVAAALLFAHRHPQASPAFHVSIMDLWRSADEFVVVEAFREAGKSTLSEEFMLLEAAYGNFKYALIFGETYTKACQRLAAIKHEALRNPKLQALFGELKGETWGVDTIVLSNGVRLEAHGWEEEIRGYKWLDARPDRAYLDDIENATNTRDSDAVQATWRKLNTQLIPALDKETRKIRITGTPLADDCLLARCQLSPEWVVAKFPIAYVPSNPLLTGVDAIDHPEAVSMWPERYPMDWIRQQRKRMDEGGLVREFVQEYMLISAQTQGKPFIESEVVQQDYDPPVWLRKVAIIDPARTVNRKTSDRTGRIVLSRMGSTLYVYESGGEYWKPDEIVAGAFDMSERHGHCEVAIERNSLDEWLMQPLRVEMMRRGMALDLMPILAPPDRSKEQFILGLQPWFKAGDIVLVGPRGKHAALLAEIANFPSGKRDILNTLAYGQRVFGGAPVYPEFGPDNIVEGLSPGQQDQLAVGVHATSSEVCAVLVALEGRRVKVLADWTSSLAAADSIKDVAALIRGAFPGRRVTWWVAADVYDQAGRVALVEAMRAAKLEVHRGAYIGQSRGQLADMLRTSIERKRLLLVGDTCKHTLNALAGGYRVAVGPDGRAKGEPEKNVSATLMQALEVLTHEVEHGHTADILPDGFGSTQNAHGQPYFSALRR